MQTTSKTAHAGYVLPSFLYQRPIRIDLVGCGGTGSQALTGLARLDRCLRGLGHPGLAVTAYDPDRVTEANVGRQLFAPCDVGLHKSDILVHRINAWFGLDWRSVPAAYGSESSAVGMNGDILVSCVDSAQARIAIHDAAKEDGAVLLWIDCGNDADSGQVVIGEIARPRRKRRLPNVIDLFPELREPLFQERTADAPSCSLAESLERQSAFINQAIATTALDALWRMVRRGHVERFAYFVNLARGQVTSLVATPEICARYLRRRARPFPAVRQDTDPGAALEGQSSQ